MFPVADVTAEIFFGAQTNAKYLRNGQIAQWAETQCANCFTLDNAEEVKKSNVNCWREIVVLLESMGRTSSR